MRTAARHLYRAPLFTLGATRTLGLGALGAGSIVILGSAIVGLSALAMLVPARRALGIEPTVALRNE